MEAQSKLGLKAHKACTEKLVNIREDKFVEDEPMLCKADKRKDNLNIIQDIITNCSALTIGLISFCSIGTRIL